MKTVCAWCPDFKHGTEDRRISHGICPACAARWEAEEAARYPDATKRNPDATSQSESSDSLSNSRPNR